MLENSRNLNPPIQYSWIWLIIGCCILLFIIFVYVTIFWITRKRKMQTIADLGPGNNILNLAELKEEYLRLIDECYNKYIQKETTLRGLHRGLSMTSRYFVFHASQFPAPRLTLRDIQRAPYPQLQHLIKEYYAKEFAQIENGNAEQSVAAAKELVRQWV